MRLRHAKLIPYRLPFRHPWVSAAGRWQQREGWLIQLQDHSGRTGWGDAAPLPALGSESAADCAAWLRSRLPELAGQHPAQAVAALPIADGHPAARCGLECALLDLLAQQAEQPLARLLANDPSSRVRLNGLLPPLDRLDGEIPDTFRTLKLKLGLAPVAREIEQLQALCRSLPDTTRLRLDANRAWSTSQAQHFLQATRDLPIDALEEPLQQADPTRLVQLQADAGYDLALDESLGRFIQDRTLAPLPVRCLVLKPTLLGGLLPSLNLARQANRQGVRCILSSSLESHAGLWPLLQLAAAVDTRQGAQAHGLATGELFSHNPGNPLPLEGDEALPGDRPGSGFILDPASISDAPWRADN